MIYIYIVTYIYTREICLDDPFRGYVWVALLSLLIAMLMYVPWRLSKDNLVPRRVQRGGMWRGHREMSQQ